MHHISRIYVGNYGYKMCWYDGLILSFIDRDTSQPCDHIIHLENGGGISHRGDEHDTRERKPGHRRPPS